MGKLIEKVLCYKISEDKWEKIEDSVPQEVDLKIFVNNKKLISILCTPYQMEYLTTGFLFSEGFFKSKTEIEAMEINEKSSIAKVILKNKFLKFPENKTITSGFGKSSIFRTTGEKVISDVIIKASSISNLTEKLHDELFLYNLSGGVHASALCSEDRIILIAEDIGRHNTLDKIIGECINKDISTKNKIIITTGRISTEMLLKCSKMGVPIVVSLKTPTGNSVKLANDLGITLIGHAKRKKMFLYTHIERISQTEV